MPWFPIIAGEIAAVERTLGIALPPGYAAIVGSPRARAMLAHPAVGAIDLGMSMADFAAHTLHRRATLPGFPPRAVVAMEGPGRFVRFWLPDPRRPGVLGETVYAWDTVDAKQTKDASGATILRSMLALVSGEATAAPRAVASPFAVEPLEPLEVPRPDDGGMCCGTWDLQGGPLTATDLGELPERGTVATVRLPSGPYRVEVRRAAPSGPEVPSIAAWRIVAEATPRSSALTASHVADVAVDLAAVALYDRRTFFSCVRTTARDAFSTALLDLAAPLVKLRIRDRTPAMVVRSGDGDGTYPFLALRAGEVTVGAELRFLPAHSHPSSRD